MRKEQQVFLPDSLKVNDNRRIYMLQKRKWLAFWRSDWLWGSGPYMVIRIERFFNISMVKKLKQFCAPFWRLLCAIILGLEYTSSIYVYCLSASKVPSFRKHQDSDFHSCLASKKQPTISWTKLWWGSLPALTTQFHRLYWHTCNAYSMWVCLCIHIIFQLCSRSFIK